jgi:ATP-binding cassette subfamily C protein/ATP-binding cassette subfamily C protein LapB
MALPRGFDTRIGDAASSQLPSSFTQRLSLARAYLKPAPIMLFDEPVNTLDGDGDRAFIQAIENLRGKATIFIVTHRPSHLKMADKILVLDTGYLRLAGPADEVRPQIPKDLL